MLCPAWRTSNNSNMVLVHVSPLTLEMLTVLFSGCYSVIANKERIINTVSHLEYSF